jgi:hypothetical protein
MNCADFVNFALLGEPPRRPPHLQPGQPWRVGVKVIDPRGNEGLRVLTLPAD